MREPVLRVEDLRAEFRIRAEWYPAVDGVSFTLDRNETLALVGESGCGKSVTALSIMGLVPEPQGRVSAGRILLDGTDLRTIDETKFEALRGDRMAMIFQEPMTSLNPVMSIGSQVAEALRVHRGLSRGDAEAKALAVLEEVKIPSAKHRFHDYPHQFSGGMRQRVMIAMALACEPTLLLADLKGRHGMAMLFITHNLGVVAQIADRVAVMYAGQIVEEASVQEIFREPAHPYTRALFSAIPRMDRAEQVLAAIPGRVPPLNDMPTGCRFAPRCPLRRQGCEAPQVLAAAAPRHLARCHIATNTFAKELASA